MILSNELKSGEKLKQEHVASMLGVSRMPLHKAFQMLENEMLVENLPRRGFYVTEIDNNKMLDAFECREALEGIAARRVALVITKKELKQLKRLFAPFIEKKEIELTIEEKSIESTRINFTKGLGWVSHIERKKLFPLINYLKKNPDVKLKITGHASGTGTEQLNFGLSLYRSKNVAKYIAMKGIHKSKLVLAGMGNNEPSGNNDTPAGRMKNRRVEFKIVK